MTKSYTSSSRWQWVWMSIPVILVLLVLALTARAQEGSQGNTTIFNGAQMTFFGNHNFLTGGGGTQPGVVGTLRSSPFGVLNFAPTATSHTGANDAGHVDGYVRKLGTGSFIFPTGDNGHYGPFGAAADGTTGAYFFVDPTSAVTSNLGGGNYAVLPTGGPFPSVTKAAGLSAVSTKEYWDIDGANPTAITLTWSTASAIGSLTTNDLSKLTIAGWNGTQWVRIPSAVDVTSVLGGASGLPAGSITSTAAFTPDTYTAYTFAAIAVISPVATSDVASTTAGVGVSINVLANDTPGTAALDPTKVKLIDPATSLPVTLLTIPGQGSYSVDPVTGLVSFTPLPTFTGTATPVQYTVTDVNGLTSNQATITVTVTAAPVMVCNGPNLLTNPSFEDPAVAANQINLLASIPGWTNRSTSPTTVNVLRPSGSLVGTASTPDNGSQYIDLQGANGVMDQIFTLTAPTQLAFSGAFANRVSTDPSYVGGQAFIQILDARDGSQVALSSIVNLDASLGDQTWVTARGLTSVLPTGNYIFRFVARTDFANFDNMSVCIATNAAIACPTRTVLKPQPGWSATASASVPGVLPSFAIDGSIQDNANGISWWTTQTANAVGQYITFDYGTPQNLVGFVYYPRTTAAQNISAYTIQTSTDGVNFTTLQSGSIAKQAVELVSGNNNQVGNPLEVDFTTAVTARYMRLVIDNTYEQSYATIVELLPIVCGPPALSDIACSNADLLNTGTNSTGTGLATTDRFDANWEVSWVSNSGGYGNPIPFSSVANATFVPAIVIGNRVPTAWANSPFGNANWIGYSQTAFDVDAVDGFGKNTYFYRYQFNITDAYLLPAFKLKLNFLSDNETQNIYVNGVGQAPQFGLPGGGFFLANQTQTSLKNGWKLGKNEIIVQMYSQPGYAGFLGQNISSCPGLDFGDAPASYNVSRTTFGAGHIVETDPNGAVTLKLGSLIDAEADGVASVSATNDNTTGLNDEDGVASFPTIDSRSVNTLTSYSVVVSLANSTSQTANLCGWIDWNNNGVFDAAEGTCATVANGATSAVLTWSNVTVNGSASVAGLYARFRITTDALASGNPNGAASNGEVEDYFIPSAVISPPVATNDVASATAGVGVSINVLTNDTPGTAAIDPTKVKLIDPATSLPVTSLTVAGEGSYLVDPVTGLVTFTPLPTFSGVATPVKYTVTDVNGLTSNQATITVTVTAAPPSSTPNPDVNATYVNVPVPGSVRTNDNVPSGTTYGTPTASIGNPSGGSFTLNPDGTYSFTGTTPGSYTYTVPVCAPGQTTGCPTQPLVITVKPTPGANTPAPPVANTDITSVKGDPTTPASVTLNVRANDGTGNTGGSLGTPTITTPPAHGTASVDPNGNVVYTPAPGYYGDDILTYQVCESPSGQCTTAQEVIHVLPPGSANTTLAADDYVATSAGTPVTGNVKLNDTDPEGNVQTVTPQTTSTPAGSLTLNADGSYTFIPASGVSGPVNFIYTTCDNGSPQACTNATLYILVAPEVPDLVPIIYALPATQYGTTNFTVVVDVYNLLPAASTGLITVLVSKDALVNLSYNGASVLVGGRLVQNSIWTFDGTSNPNAYLFTTPQVIAGGSKQSFGLTGVLTPGNTKGTVTISSTIVGGSGGEVRINNNSDADKIDYFKK